MFDILVFSFIFAITATYVMFRRFLDHHVDISSTLETPLPNHNSLPPLLERLQLPSPVSQTRPILHQDLPDALTTELHQSSSSTRPRYRYDLASLRTFLSSFPSPPVYLLAEVIESLRRVVRSMSLPALSNPTSTLPKKNPALGESLLHFERKKRSRTRQLKTGWRNSILSVSPVTLYDGDSSPNRLNTHSSSISPVTHSSSISPVSVSVSVSSKRPRRKGAKYMDWIPLGSPVSPFVFDSNSDDDEIEYRKDSTYVPGNSESDEDDRDYKCVPGNSTPQKLTRRGVKKETP